MVKRVRMNNRRTRILDLQTCSIAHSYHVGSFKRLRIMNVCSICSDMSIGSRVGQPFLCSKFFIHLCNHCCKFTGRMSSLKWIIHSMVTIQGTVIMFATYLAGKSCWSLRCIHIRVSLLMCRIWIHHWNLLVCWMLVSSGKWWLIPIGKRLKCWISSLSKGLVMRVTFQWILLMTGVGSWWEPRLPKVAGALVEESWLASFVVVECKSFSISWDILLLLIFQQHLMVEKLGLEVCKA